MLRLPSFIPRSSVSLDYGSIGMILFLSQTQVNHQLVLLGFSVRLIQYKPQFPMVTAGSPVFPYFPLLPLMWSQIPVDSPQLSPTSKRWFDMAPTTSTVKASTINIISGLNTYLQQSLSTLHANISIDYARLAFGGRLLLTKQDSFPCREMLRCFISVNHLFMMLRKSPSHGLFTAQGRSTFKVKH